jgi:hypothetical protein
MRTVLNSLLHNHNLISVLILYSLSEPELKFGIQISAVFKNLNARLKKLFNKVVLMTSRRKVFLEYII